MKPETEKTFKVAISLCLVCSIIVSSLAVGLKSTQEEQKEAFRMQSVLEAAGLWREGSDAQELFKKHIEIYRLDLEDYREENGELTDPKFDLAKSLQNESLHRELESDIDIAGLKKMERYTLVYRVKSQDGDDSGTTTVILPIRGKGLWSTLYGFVALDLGLEQGPLAVKVRGLTYYKHGETPGLGGEVDNELWKAKWPGKLVFDDEWNVKVEVSKSASGDSKYSVDALSGATLTSNGVTNMLHFWLGDKGFGKYIRQLAAKPAADKKRAVDARPRASSTVLVSRRN